MSNHRKAPVEELEKLHAALAQALANKITSNEFTAADLAVARQFLKDNGIDAIASEGSPLGELATKLPFQGNPEPDEAPGGE